MGCAGTAAASAVGLPERSRTASAVAWAGAVLSASGTAATAATGTAASNEHTAFGAWLLRSAERATVLPSRLRARDRRSGGRTGPAHCPAGGPLWAADGAALHQPTASSGARSPAGRFRWGPPRKTEAPSLQLQRAREPREDRAGAV